MPTELLIATHNWGKLREYAALLAGLPLTLVTPDELGIHLEVIESGETYADNARLKAVAYAQASSLLTLADDSGLEVDALDGAPGVRSARYAVGDDADRVTALLRTLACARVPEEDRSARFRCVIALAAPDDRTWFTEGECAGRIIDTPRGSGGFGYDPIFFLPSYGCTMAELPPEEKNRVSHRARAAQAIRPILAQLINEQGVESCVE
ncbi:MAG: RdgB/HAM1 family non-canonical purine NTP pyrophosphatase [Anaerolineae bacterium]|nr:MAG: RdgB/HAM1 family non-canonical purine NTP pyrophosphatase [Anaerolineae bacterium]